MNAEAPSMLVLALQSATALGIVTFWITWLSSEQNEPWFPPGFIEHERAFVYPDCLCAALLVVSAVLGWNGSAYGSSVGLIAAGMLLFLGVIDAAYMIQNGMLAPQHDGRRHLAIVGSILFTSLVLIVAYGP